MYKKYKDIYAEEELERDDMQVKAANKMRQRHVSKHVQFDLPEKNLYSKHTMIDKASCDSIMRHITQCDFCRNVEFYNNNSAGAGANLSGVYKLILILMIAVFACIFILMFLKK